MIADTVNDMLDAVIVWLYDRLAFLARVLLHMLPPDFTSLSTDAMQYGMLLGSGFKVLVFASYAIVIVVGGFLVMSHETVQTRYSLREIAPRLVIGMLLAGLVWVIVHQSVVVTNDVVAALVSVDVTSEGAVCTDPSFDWRTDDLEECDWQEGAERSQFAFWVLFSPRADQEIGLFHIIMITISIACLLVLLVTSILRYIVLFFVVALAPAALACHGLPITEQFAHLWWRMLGACMASSIGQAALIWMWHEMRTYLHDADNELLGYSSITRHVYLVVLVWMMWRVHAEAFRIARGRPVKMPGSRLLAAFVMSKFADRRTGSKRKFSTPGTIWGTDMTRPPWRRKDPDSGEESAKQTTGGGKGGGKGGGQGGGAPSGPGKGGPDKGPNNGGGSGPDGPTAPERPASPHDQRSGAEPVTVLEKSPADTAPRPEQDRGAPPWKRAHPTVAEGGFDPDIAATSLRGHPGSGGAAPAKPGAPGSKSGPGKPQSAPGGPEPQPASGQQAPRPAPIRAGQGAGPPRPSGRPRDGVALPLTPPQAKAAPAPLPEAAGPAPRGTPAPAGPRKQPGPSPHSSAPEPTDSKKKGE